ncbi:MAG TPA: hypothetical protein VG841_08400 [Caulobacterales bacterium]|nr:hypothetical protein [Caulobacterales bacterium]
MKAHEPGVSARRQPNWLEIIGIAPFGLATLLVAFVIFRLGETAGWGDVASGVAALAGFLLLGFAVRVAALFWLFAILVALYCAALVGVLASRHAASPALAWLADPVAWFARAPGEEVRRALAADLTTWSGAAAALAALAFLLWCARRWRTAMT